MRRYSTFFWLLVAVVFVAGASRSSAATAGPYALSFNNLVTGAGPLPFSFPKFDSSLGSLQSIALGWDFSGTVVGSATGVSQSDSINSTVTHWVFFHFTDVSDNVFIVEPTLSLTASIPPGAPNTPIAFGPSFQSTISAFSVTSGDLRFRAWGDGPGDVFGSLSVFFTDTAEGFSGLKFFPGADSGVYSGSLSIAYTYEPIPEPCSFTLVALGLLLTSSRMRKSGRNAAIPPPSAAVAENAAGASGGLRA